MAGMYEFMLKAARDTDWTVSFDQIANADATERFGSTPIGDGIQRRIKKDADKVARAAGKKKHTKHPGMQTGNNDDPTWTDKAITAARYTGAGAIAGGTGYDAWRAFTHIQNYANGVTAAGNQRSNSTETMQAKKTKGLSPQEKAIADENAVRLQRKIDADVNIRNYKPDTRAASKLHQGILGDLNARYGAGRTLDVPDVTSSIPLDLFTRMRKIYNTAVNRVLPNAPGFDSRANFNSTFAGAGRRKNPLSFSKYKFGTGAAALLPWLAPWLLAPASSDQPKPKPRKPLMPTNK